MFNERIQCELMATLIFIYLVAFDQTYGIKFSLYKKKAIKMGK